MKRLSKGDEKVKISLTDFMERYSFQKAILALRKKYKIPKDGFSKDIIIRQPDTYLWYKIPQILDEKLKKDNYYQHRVLRKSIGDILEGFPLKTNDVISSVENYLYFNDITQAINYTSSYGMFNIVDLDEEVGSIQDVFTDREGDPVSFLKNQISMFKSYPVAISIHPDATQRDLIDFIKRSWDEIDQIKSSRKSKMLNVRKRKVSAKIQKDLIYKNRDKKISEIRRILADKQIFLDDGAIGKIISLEIKRRKNK